MTQRKKICIYCASSRDIDRAYFDAAERLGTLLAEKGIDCICGAGREGLMGKLTDSALSAGGGTLEELLEIITWKQLGLYSKPIIMLNVDGFFDHLIAMLNHAVDQHFMKQSHRNLWHVATTAEEALNLLEQLPADEQEAESKYAK